MEVRLRSDMKPMETNLNSSYQLMFKVRFDVPFPFYEDEKIENNNTVVGQVQRDVNRMVSLAEHPTMLPMRETILSKVNSLRRHKAPDPTNVPQDQHRRREAVFDHHEVHPHWAKDEIKPTDQPVIQDINDQKSDSNVDDIKLKSRPVHHCHSMRLPETKKNAAKDKLNTEEWQSTGHPLDRKKSASVRIDKLSLYGKEKENVKSQPRRNSGVDESVMMGQVNQMRTERLANALKALEKRNETDGLSRTQSMKTTRKQRPTALEAKNSLSGSPKKKPIAHPVDHAVDEDHVNIIEFRRRTSSVPPKYDAMKKKNQRADMENHDKFAPQTAMDMLSPGDDPLAYERMRTFTIDQSKGSVINRGDSFRRRCNTGASPRVHQKSPLSPVGQQNNIASVNSSNYSSRSHSPMPWRLVSPPEAMSPATTPSQCSSRQYHIVVLGLDGVGKTSIINQFMTSDYCNPFQNDGGPNSAPMDNTVTVILNGEESQLSFIEVDNQKNDLSLTLSGAGYLVIYSIDDAFSFENAKQVLFQLRLQMHSAEKPIILVGNKMDLERKRVVSTEEAKVAARENDCKFVEIAVALGHHVDELLVAILAQVRHNDKDRMATLDAHAGHQCKHEEQFDNSPPTEPKLPSSGSSSRSSSDSLSARGFKGKDGVTRQSTKRVKNLTPRSPVGDEPAATSCSNLTAVGYRIADKVFGRRRGSRSLEDLLNIRK